MAVRARVPRIIWLAGLVAAFCLAWAPVGASAVAWPASAGLLVSEVMTGGASASDEFVELYNASPIEVDLGGLELVYVTSSGSTVTRKQTWSALALGAHRHLLVANSAGLYAASADGTYSGGLSGAGGSIAVRTLGGTVIDSLSWGDAASALVEARPGSAPPAGSSLERRPGAALGNGTDTNDNLADTLLNAAPIAQGLAAPPVPALVATPSPTSTPVPTPICEWAAPTPTATPWPFPTSVASPTPAASPTPGPTGPIVTLTGQLITATGLIDDGRTAYLDLGAAGVALRLESADWPALVAGTYVSATGVLGERHGEATLHLGSAVDLVYLGEGSRPAPLRAATGLACEAFESRLIAVEGV
ncbi:MAG TPA: lamin tail domain-containing protein, partial [Candidatus Limnocylindrales bacterium]